MGKVAVLLSSYNGAAYIEKQIESIMNQDYEEFQLYIRDDGSETMFVNRLTDLQKKYGFELFIGENVGFLNSFYWLLEHVDDADYYAFSDQDDIWFSDKLSKGIEWLKCQDSRVPLLYHGAYEIQNTQGTKKGLFQYPDEGYDFRRSITENHYSGFAMIVNKTMRNYMLRADLQNLVYHDWWAANIALSMGKAHFSQEICAIHRDHGDNVTKITWKKRFLWFWESLQQESEIKKRMQEFDRLFGDQISLENKKILMWFAFSKYHFKYAISKAFYYKRWRPDMMSEISIRILMLLGRV